MDASGLDFASTVVLVGVSSFVVAIAMAWVTIMIVLKRREAVNHLVLPPPLPVLGPKLRGREFPAPDPAGLYDYFKNLPDSELRNVFRDHIPVGAAAILRFVPLDQRARIMKGLTQGEKNKIETMGEAMNNRSAFELIRINDRTRRRLARPEEDRSFKNDNDFWTETLKRTGAQFALLDALEKTRPDLIAVISNFRGRIDQALSLPKERVERILAKLSDKELASALSSCPKNIADNLTKELSPDRRKRILARIRTQGILPSAVSEHSVRKLFKRLQEAV